MRYWGFFFLIVGLGTYFLPQIGMATIGRPIVFAPIYRLTNLGYLGENGIYGHGALAGFGLVLLIGSLIKPSK
jgi:hypothetical protein